MRGGMQTFLALTNVPVAGFNLVAACLPSVTPGMFILHIFGFAFAGAVGLYIWNDR